ncbi:hypothetical protein pdam_00023156, partial [Pocillopora damicornis]
MANITGTSSQLPIGVLTSLLAFNIILSFTASLGNVLILLTIYKVSSLHPVTKLLFASLATTDLCVGLFSQPLFVASIILKIDLANTDLDILYHLSEVIYISSYVLCGVSLLISAAISVDRLLVLLLRLRYREVVTQKRAQVVILLCWVIAISCGLVRVWSPTVSEIVVFVAGFVSLVTSVICYAKIHQRLQRNQATREDNYGCEQSNEGEEVGGGEEGTGLTTGEGRAAGEEAEATTGAGISLQLPIGVLTSLLAFNIILSFTAFLGNVLILLTIYKVSFLHPVTKFLFACLATTDLCVGLFSQPLFVANMILNIDLANTDLGILSQMNEVVFISSNVLCGVSVLISTAISVDRLLV